MTARFSGLIIEDIVLRDGPGDFGGKANADETLADFLEYVEDGEISIKELNKELKKCGIMPITLEDIKIIGVKGK